MKYAKAYLVLVFFLISVVSSGQYTQQELTSIKNAIQDELNDSIKSKWNKERLEGMLQLLSNPDSLFPYSDFDLVCYYKYRGARGLEPALWNKIYRNHISEIMEVSSEHVTSILKLVNNPMNFSGECGTPFIRGSFVFFKGEEEVASIDHACDGLQLFLEPKNLLSRWGGLNEEGRERFLEVLEK